MSASSEGPRRWFYVREGRRHGPVEMKDLVDLVLRGEVPEDGLVWNSGLPEWVPVREVEEIRRELPPPLPSPPAPPPPKPVFTEATDAARAMSAAEDVEQEKAKGSPESAEAGEADGLTASQRRRRKRKHRHRDSKKRPPWLWPLAVVLVGLMIFLWWLLRRMNEVPPGRIIQTGSLRALPSSGVRLPVVERTRRAGA
jgi:GYF domain 2